MHVIEYRDCMLQPCVETTRMTVPVCVLGHGLGQVLSRSCSLLLHETHTELGVVHLAALTFFGAGAFLALGLAST